MKTNMKLALATLVAASALSTSALAQNDATGTASAKVATALALTAGQNLNCGTFTPGTAAGTIQVNDAGTVVANGVTPIGSSATAGTFNVMGQAGSPYTVTLPSNVNLTSGSNSMTASSLEFKAVSGSTPTLSSGGTDTVNVGGTLAVAANQPAGAYTGTYNVGVSY